MLYEGALVPNLALLVYCAIFVFFWHCSELGCALPLLKGPTVDTDAVGAIVHGVRRDIATLSAVLKPVMRLTLSAPISVDAYTGTHRCLSVLVADVVPVIRLQRPIHSACIYGYNR